MTDITGPISTLPGTIHKLPTGTLCDGYNVEEEHNVLAVVRIQGETDSFGSEMNDFCQACYDKMLAEEEENRDVPTCCEWCKKSSLTCQLTRDFDEGTCGPVYNVCGACRKDQNDAARAELENMTDDFDD
jgi:hypothetical protein